MKRSEGVETNVAESNSSSGGTTTEHSNKRIQFECKWCRKTFKYPSQLKEHVRVHTKEKPFPCKFCDRVSDCMFKRSPKFTLPFGNQMMVILFQHVVVELRHSVIAARSRNMSVFIRVQGKFMQNCSTLMNI